MSRSDNNENEVSQCWMVHDEKGDVCGVIDYEREDTAQQFEAYQNGDGGLTFEGGVGYTVTLAYWGEN